MDPSEFSSKYLAKGAPDDLSKLRDSLAKKPIGELVSEAKRLGIQDAQMQHLVIADDVPGLADLICSVASGHVAKGKPATHPLGVAYCAGWERPVDGFAEHARRSARALAMTGCPVHLRSIAPGFLADDPDSIAVQSSVRDMLDTSIGRYSVQIHQIVIGNGELLYKLLHHPRLTQGELEIVNKHRVIYTVWERQEVPNHIVDALNRVGQVWVACEASAATMIRSGVDIDRVRVVPMPFMPDDAYVKLRRKRRGQHPVRFYHIGKWEPRKAQHEMIGSFMMAFKPGKEELHIKTNGGAPGIVDYPETPTDSIRHWLSEPIVVSNGWTAENVASSIKIYTSQISEKQIVALHAHCDVYLSLSRGEGFDIPAFCAKLAGNRMVHTQSGGPQDYSTPDDFTVPIKGTTDCHRVYGWQDGATYLAVDPMDAVYYMKSAARCVETSDLEWSSIAGFDARVVGGHMLENLTELVGKNGKVY